MKNIFTPLLVSLAFPLAAMSQTLHVGYSADDIASKAGGLEAGNYIAAAIKIPAELAAAYKGGQITGIDVGYGSATTKAVTLFISDDLNSAPSYTQAARIDKVSHWTNFELTQPWTIDGTKDIYVGYYVLINSTRDFPIGNDNLALYPDNCNFIRTAASVDGLWSGEFEHSAPTFGNLCLRAAITGGESAAEMAHMQGVVVSPKFVRSGDTFEIATAVVNWGDADVTSVEMSYKVGDDAAVSKEFTFSMPVETGELTTLTFTGCSTEQEMFDLPVEVTLTKVNGKAPAVSSSQTGYFDCIRDAYPRSMVVEEGTGTWCGYCPIGYVGLETLREDHPDGSFIGIAVHDNDVMENYNYDSYLNQFISGYPKCVVNRISEYTDIIPSFGNLEGIYKTLRNSAAYEKVDVRSEIVDNATLHATATVSFLKDYPDNNFAIAFVLTEDGVGPHMQYNGFSGGNVSSNGMAEEFESKGPYVSLIFNDVARYLSSTTGHDGSVPSSVSRGESHDFSMDLPLYDCSNVNNVNVIALLIDRTTGEILNAGTNKAGKSSGVDSVEAGKEDAPVEYYTLSGIRVTKPGQGIYIMRRGTQVEKVIIR